MKSAKHPLNSQLRARQPLELLYALSDGCMHLLSSNAWKVVSYIARQNIEAYAKKFAAANDPFKLLDADLGQWASRCPVAKPRAKALTRTSRFYLEAV